jgi:hypothetical protein
MARRKRSDHRTPLASFLCELIAEEKITFDEAAKIAGCRKSVLHSWTTGSYPAEGVIYLARLCKHYDKRLTVALIGEN